jgi:hypothetical protein
MNTPRPVPMPKDMTTAMEWAGNFLFTMMQDWPDHPFDLTKARFNDYINQFPPEIADNMASDKKRGRAVTNMAWAIAPDEALILEFNDPKCLWMTTNMGQFMSSMDFLYRNISHTPSRTVLDKDGKYRLIITHEDPGYHNWVDTQGLIRGNLTYRALMSEEFVEFRTKLVKRAELAKALPADSAKVTPEDRVKQLRARFDGIRQRYGL